MTSANSATASVSAKPRSTLPNTRGAASGCARAGDEAAEDVADADADAGEGDGGKASADELGCRSVHGNILSRCRVVFCSLKATPSVRLNVDGVVEIQAGQDREDIGLQESDQQLETGEDDDEGVAAPSRR